MQQLNKTMNLISHPTTPYFDSGARFLNNNNKGVPPHNQTSVMSTRQSHLIYKYNCHA